MPSNSIDLENLSKASFGEQVSTLRQLFGFSKTEFARVLDVNEKTIRRWEEGVILPHGSHKLAIDALRKMAESLGELFEPDVIKVWIDRENPALGGQRPRDFAKQPGGIFLMSHLLSNVGR